MTMNVIHISDVGDLERAAAEFTSQIGERRIFTFYGEMGAGKTTFISALARHLGVDEGEANSPSFAIVNEYTAADGSVIYHFDLYRLDNEAEAYDIGVDDYFDSGSLCLIEWPERLGSLLPDDAVRVDIRVNDDNSRDLIIS